MTWRYLFAFIVGKKKFRCLIAVVCAVLYLCTTVIRLVMLGRVGSIKDQNTIRFSKQLEFLGNSEVTLRWIPYKSSTAFVIRSDRRRKFIFAFRYYEQLGRATGNLLELCALAKYGERYVVAPFVNNSRMAGIPFGVGHHFRKKRVASFSPFQTYFDVEQVNEQLRSNGYSTLTSLQDMVQNCNRRLNVVVHLLYHERKSIEDAVSWYRISEHELQEIYVRARQNNGWTNCPHIRKSNIDRQLGDFKVTRYVCIDPEIIRSAQQLEEEVLQGAHCVAIVQWKGIGPGRTHFSLSKSSVLRPSDLRHNAQLIEIARTFIKSSGLGKSFISVHVRAERHIVRRGPNITRQCFQKLAARIQTLQTRHKWKMYLSSDMGDYGSDTLIHDVSRKTERLALYRELNEILHFPTTLSNIQGLSDSGAIAIIEMHILAAGQKLVTVGGGNFQDWLIELFSKKVDDYRDSLYRICEMR